ncbi:MAG: DUF1328 domain-containing protein [Tissierellales bacterium]|jgi:uncharacterized membrane protein YtjA (UPF0391 family)|nr:DUF1328 domain-containing protein [Tissierellales bacterium]
MLKWAIIFLVIAAVASLFGFSGIANVSGSISKFLFFIIAVVIILAIIFALGIL